MRSVPHPQIHGQTVSRGMQKGSLEARNLFRIIQARSDNQLRETQPAKLLCGRHPSDV